MTTKRDALLMGKNDLSSAVYNLASAGQHVRAGRIEDIIEEINEIFWEEE